MHLCSKIRNIRQLASKLLQNSEHAFEKWFKSLCKSNRGRSMYKTCCYTVTNQKEAFRYIASWQSDQHRVFNLAFYLDNQVSLFSSHIHYAIFNTQKKKKRWYFLYWDALRHTPFIIRKAPCTCLYSEHLS